MTQLDSNAQPVSASKDAAVLSLLSTEVPAPAPEPTLNNSPTEVVKDKAAPPVASLNNLSLKDLINPALLEHLNKIDEAQLAKLSLKELLTEVTKDAIAGPWQITNESDSQRLEATYELSASWKARYILSDILGKAFSLMLAPEELALNKTEDGYTLRIVVLNKTSDRSKAALAFTQYVNFKMTCESSDDCYYDEYADPATKDKQQLATPTLDISEQSYEQFVSCTSKIELVDESNEGETGTKKIRLAAAKLGKWKHPIYKVVEFTEKDFEDAINNFNNRVLGFEPPLFLGHANSMVNSGTGITYETAEGAPAEGFLLNLYTEDDVLYSEWEIVNDTVYDAVKQRRYRYNSGEFVRGFRTKDDGSNCGMVVIGMALTNRPFVPDLPQAKALTDAQIRPDISSVFRLSFKEDDCVDETLNNSQPLDSTPDLDPEQSTSSLSMTVPQTEESSATQPTPVAPNTTPTTPSNTESLSLAQLVEKQGIELQAVKLAYEKQLAEALTTIQTLSTKVESQEAQLREQKIQEKLTWLNKLALPADVKESYTTLIKNGTLGESESAVLETLERTSNAFNQSLTEQQGASTETQELNDPLHADPYKDVIERNNQIANKLRESYLTR